MNHVLISTRRFERDTKNLTKRRPQVRDHLEFALGLLAEDAFHPSLKTHKLKGALEGSFACSMTHDLRILFEFIQHEGALAILLLTVGTHDEVY
jgi:addiction module RelE/StbE family toxin